MNVYLHLTYSSQMHVCQTGFIYLWTYHIQSNLTYCSHIPIKPCWYARLTKYMNLTYSSQILVCQTRSTRIYLAGGGGGGGGEEEGRQHQQICHHTAMSTMLSLVLHAFLTPLLSLYFYHIMAWATGKQHVPDEHQFHQLAISLVVSLTEELCNLPSHVTYLPKFSAGFSVHTEAVSCANTESFNILSCLHQYCMMSKWWPCGNKTRTMWS